MDDWLCKFGVRGSLCTFSTTGAAGAYLKEPVFDLSETHLVLMHLVSLEFAISLVLASQNRFQFEKTIVTALFLSKRVILNEAARLFLLRTVLSFLCHKIPGRDNRLQRHCKEVCPLFKYSLHLFCCFGFVCLI